MTRLDLDHFLGLLDRERQLLESGRIAELVRLAEEREVLVGQLTRLPRHQTTDLVALRRDAARNDTLLAAARDGILAALNQISEARHGAPQNTYSPDGQRNSMASRRAKLERKF